MSEKIGMEFLGIFGKKKEKEPEKPKEIKKIPQDVLDFIILTCNTTRKQFANKNCSYMKFTKGKTGLTDSKIGGIPFMTSKTNIPMCEDGRHMQLMVCQINAEDIPNGLGIPQEGIYQIWIDLDNQFDGYSDTREGYTTILYYSLIDVEKNGISEEECKERYHNPHPGNNKLKLNGEYKITFSNAAKDIPSLYEPIVYKNVLKKLAMKLHGSYEEGWKTEDIVRIVGEVYDTSYEGFDLYDFIEKYENDNMRKDMNKAKIGGFIPVPVEPNPDDHTFPLTTDPSSEYGKVLNILLCYFDLRNNEPFTVIDSPKDNNIYFAISGKNINEIRANKAYISEDVIY